MVKIIFIENDGKRRQVSGASGDSLIQVAWDNDVDIEGACEGAMACSTCHVVVDENWFKKLDETSEEEEDMLDLVYGLSSTSRLGCQIIISEDLDGLILYLPDETHNKLLD
ncbi:MAG: Ferredoxin-6 [Alphaproteobacteria bacterium MarineAlpha12_Bin1]|jgi:ferredoxin|nr:MAG: Ferredoxin-6 [Alphaproteobacteria bacterium MarineAlpha12_Bin1]|tara:strand:- start:564 stop:896 length:333 start_codon:yes stop_codon:yes gene_type:complete